MELYPRRASCSFVLDVSTRLTASDAVGWSRFPVAAVRAGLYPVATLGGSWLREDASVRLFFIWRSPKLGSPKGKVGAARRRVGLWQLRGCIGMLPSPTLLTGPLTVLAIRPTHLHRGRRREHILVRLGFGGQQEWMRHDCSLNVPNGVIPGPTPGALVPRASSLVLRSSCCS